MINYSEQSMWNKGTTIFPKYHLAQPGGNNDTCLTTSRPNVTALSNLYEGIPETIIFNLISWILLILLFAILRNRAWDYGRLALVHTEKWTQLFYKNTDDAIAALEETHDVSLMPDTGCLWFPSIFRITRDRIFARCGPDAAHYLSFQIHLLILATCITIFSVVVILPINFQGELQGDRTNFGHTTISNLDPESRWLWVHVCACFAFLPLTILIMRRTSGRIPTSTQLTSRTLMITHISHRQRKTEDIKNYIQVRYPNLQIKDVQIAYKVKKLMKLEKQRQLVHEAKLYCLMNNKNDAKVQPYGCITCCPWKTVNALEYYTMEEQRLTDLVIAERRKALQNPLSIAFVTVDSEELAHHVINTFEPGSVRHWMVSKAPSPSDINWENLEISYRNWYSKAIIINFILFVVLFFLTTPLILVNQFNKILIIISGQDNQRINPLLSEILPTLLLLSMSALMPVLVAYTDEWMSHWTKSKQNLHTMRKTFSFLLFMVLILPSLGLTSAQGLLEWTLGKADNNTTAYRWQCVFLSDKGAFFVNYVITSAFIGTALELLRFPELAMYAFRLLRIKSDAEKASIRKEILSEFPFGIHYAWTLLIFTISTVYSLTCPLITPFGLLYLCLKHLVDKYNIYYVYRPIAMSTGEGQQIHAEAVKMVRVAIFLLQIVMGFFSFVRGGFNVMTCILFLASALTGSFFFFLSPFPACKPNQSNRSQQEITSEQYVAPVLLSTQNIQNRHDDSPLSYGSNGTEIHIENDPGSSVA